MIAPAAADEFVNDPTRDWSMNGPEIVFVPEGVPIVAPPTPECWKHRDLCRVIYEDLRSAARVYCAACDVWGPLFVAVGS